jgi:hypothetical protein
MNVKIELNDVQLDKRYLVNVEDKSAPKSNRNRRHFSLSGILGSDVKLMLEEDPNLRIESIEEQIIDVTSDTLKKLTDLYKQTCELIEAYDVMDKLIQTEMDYYKVMKLLYDVYLGPSSEKTVSCFLLRIVKS